MGYLGVRLYIDTSIRIILEVRLYLTKSRMKSYCLCVLTGVVSSHRGRLESIGAGRRTPETEPDVYRPSERGTTARAMVRAQHPPIAQPDRQVHGRAEPDAIPAEIPATRVKERSVLVQKQTGQVQAAKDVPVRRHVTERSILHAHVSQSRLMPHRSGVVIRKDFKNEQYYTNLIL